ncbi:MAG: hypothetical protein GF388_01660 [Candidatus Aegiribacteria sp.]|nr:hypothetical protein [Candidatus Aegiribacteria sp.]MBD3294080.1 hypothetical protein [Candidatus Fermentibacteria bacterium]
MKKLKTAAAVLTTILTLAACGGNPPASQAIVGTWQAELVATGETNTVVFSEDGTAQAAGEDIQNYTVQDGDPPVLKITENDELLEVEMSFSSQDVCTLSVEGMKMVLTRME